jgi:hypothetical protein
VFAGEQIAPKMPSLEGNFISIALTDGSKTTLRCRSNSDCEAGYKVPDIHKPDSFLSRVTQAIRQLYPTEVKKLAIAGSRSTAGPSNAVLKVEKNGIPDFEPALVQVEPGLYTARLVPWPQEGTEAAAISGVLDWRPPVAGWKATSRVAPGLYQLALNGVNGSRIGSRAMVIIQAVPEYNKFRQAFVRFNETTREWNDEGNEQGMRSLQAGFLIVLWRNPALAE